MIDELDSLEIRRLITMNLVHIVSPKGEFDCYQFYICMYVCMYVSFATKIKILQLLKDVQLK